MELSSRIHRLSSEAMTEESILDTMVETQYRINDRLTEIQASVRTMSELISALHLQKKKNFERLCSTWAASKNQGNPNPSHHYQLEPPRPCSVLSQIASLQASNIKHVEITQASIDRSEVEVNPNVSEAMSSTEGGQPVTSQHKDFESPALIIQKNGAFKVFEEMPEPDDVITGDGGVSLAFRVFYEMPMNLDATIRQEQTVIAHDTYYCDSLIHAFERVNERHKVVSDTIGKITFRKLVGRLDNSVISASGAKLAFNSSEEIVVEVVTIPFEEVIPDTERVLLLKTDIQGWEYHVLRGSSKLLSRKASEAPYLIYEEDERLLNAINISANKIREFLRSVVNEVWDPGGLYQVEGQCFDDSRVLFDPYAKTVISRWDVLKKYKDARMFSRLASEINWYSKSMFSVWAPEDLNLREVETSFEDIMSLNQLGEDYTDFVVSIIDPELEPKTNKKLKGGSFNRKMQNLTGFYSSLEFFMVENVRNAIKIDEHENGGLTTSMVNEVFFVLQSSYRRAITTESINSMFAVLSVAMNLLSDEYRQALRKTRMDIAIVLNKMDFSRGYDGKDVVQQSCQACVFKISNETWTPWEWWDYATDFAIRCPTKENKHMKECTEDVIRSLNVDLRKVNDCIGDPEAKQDVQIDKDSSFQETEPTGCLSDVIKISSYQVGCNYKCGSLISPTGSRYDASAHMTEETKNADINRPKGIISAIGLSILFGWGYLIGITFAVRNITYLLSKDNVAGGYALAEVFYLAFPNRFGHGVGVIICLGVVVVAIFFCGMSLVTSNSKMAYAFSRDGAMPLSSLWHKVNKQEVPIMQSGSPHSFIFAWLCHH